MPNLANYPCPPGNKLQTIATINGPTSYTQLTPGTPPTGGMILNAKDLGLSAIEWMEGGVSDDGQYNCEAIIDYNPVRDVPSVRLQFSTLATGAQVGAGVNLSARTFRVMIFGF